MKHYLVIWNNEVSVNPNLKPNSLFRLSDGLLRFSISWGNVLKVSAPGNYPIKSDFPKERFIEFYLLFTILAMFVKNIDDEENERGTRCIAAPAYNEVGKAVAAVSISGPAFRVTQKMIQETLKKEVMETALKISQRLGLRERR